MQPLFNKVAGLHLATLLKVKLFIDVLIHFAFAVRILLFD